MKTGTCKLHGEFDDKDGCPRCDAYFWKQETEGYTKIVLEIQNMLNSSNYSSETVVDKCTNIIRKFMDT